VRRLTVEVFDERRQRLGKHGVGDGFSRKAKSFYIKELCHKRGDDVFDARRNGTNCRVHGMGKGATGFHLCWFVVVEFCAVRSCSVTSVLRGGEGKMEIIGGRSGTCVLGGVFSRNVEKDRIDRDNN